ncbi:MAG: ribonuclease HII [Chloroflexota bacterium]|nr:ribonuclease HII [Chloroflexota bacterium]
MVKKFDVNLLPSAPDFSFEMELWESGLALVAGVDEAGRGALAGPVAAAALIFPSDPSLAAELHGVRDSKQMTPGQRDEWAQRLPEIALACGVAFASPGEIDELGIVPSTRLAMQRALDLLETAPEYLLIDYVELPERPIPQKALVKGDARSLSIAAASILAKTARDTCLRDLARVYPGYGFASNKGYGTEAHREALARLGPCKVHRRKFQGCKG